MKETELKVKEAKPPVPSALSEAEDESRKTNKDPTCVARVVQIFRKLRELHLVQELCWEIASMKQLCWKSYVCELVFFVFGF